jgi:hypothetical protein
MQGFERFWDVLSHLAEAAHSIMGHDNDEREAIEASG